MNRWESSLLSEITSYSADDSSSDESDQSSPESAAHANRIWRVITCSKQWFSVPFYLFHSSAMSKQIPGLHLYGCILGTQNLPNECVSLQAYLAQGNAVKKKPVDLHIFHWFALDVTFLLSWFIAKERDVHNTRLAGIRARTKVEGGGNPWFVDIRIPRLPSRERGSNNWNWTCSNPPEAGILQRVFSPASHHHHHNTKKTFRSVREPLMRARCCYGTNGKTHRNGISGCRW